MITQLDKILDNDNNLDDDWKKKTLYVDFIISDFLNNDNSLNSSQI